MICTGSSRSGRPDDERTANPLLSLLVCSSMRSCSAALRVSISMTWLERLVVKVEAVLVEGAAEAAIEALALLRLIMGSATKRVRTPTGIKEEPDWATQLKACRLVLAMAFAAVPQFRAGASKAPPDRRTLRIVP